MGEGGVSFSDDLNEQDQFSQIHNICFIGAGHVGGISAAVMAYQNPNINFKVVDIDRSRIAAWNSESLPVYEPGLHSILAQRGYEANTKERNIKFSCEIDEAILDADVIFITVNTPLEDLDHQSMHALDIVHVEACVGRIARVATRGKIIVQKSTVPCGTADKIGRIFKSLARPTLDFPVLANPEFLAGGTAIHNLLCPDRVVIGSDQHGNGLRAAKLLRRLYQTWIPHDRIMLLTTKSAELTKLASNTLLAQRISSINAISAICEETGADIDEVAVACGLDRRIGPEMLKASLGYGGSCLKKDVLALAHISKDLGLQTVGSYFLSVDDVNESQKSRFFNRITKAMDDELCDKRIAVLGCAFKEGTGDLRESPAVSLIAELLCRKAYIVVYDGMIEESRLTRALMGNQKLCSIQGSWHKRLLLKRSIREACEGACVLVIATDLAELHACEDTRLVEGGKSSIDWKQVAREMVPPKLVFDGRNVVDGQELAKLGLDVRMVGKRPFLNS